MQHYGLDLLSREDYADWLRIIPKGECPFCEWKKYQYVLYEGKYWLWIACRAPYWKYHTMMIPKRHFVELNQLTVVEMGELIEVYSIAIEKFRKQKVVIDDEIVDRLLFFWRLRDNPHEDKSDTNRMTHFHMHLTPDKAGLLDPVLDSSSCEWNPKDFVIEKI